MLPGQRLNFREIAELSLIPHPALAYCRFPLPKIQPEDTQAIELQPHFKLATSSQQTTIKAQKNRAGSAGSRRSAS